MKKLLLSSMSVLLVGCATTSSPAIENSNTLSTMNTNGTITNQGIRIGEPNPSSNTTDSKANDKKNPAKEVKNLQKTSYLTFDMPCSYFQCDMATQHKTPGDEGTSVQAPSGYKIVELDALPKDYLLLVKEGKVFTYQSSTGKITPFTVDKTGVQLSLGKNEGLTGKESFTKKGTYLLIKFFMKDPSVDEGPMGFFNGSSEPKAAYIYDSTRDTLTEETSFSTKVFNTSAETGKPELTNSPYEFDAVEKRIIVYGGFAYETFAGPMGDFNPALLPLKVYSLDGKLLKQFKEGLLANYLRSESTAYLLQYEHTNADDLFEERPIGTLTAITAVDLSSKNITSTTYTLTSKVREFLKNPPYRTVPKELEENFSHIPFTIAKENNVLYLRAYGETKLLLTLEGTTIVKAELRK